MCSTNSSGVGQTSTSKLLTLPKELIQIPDRERQSYDAQFKIRVVFEADQSSNRKAAAKFGISEANVRRWRKCLPTLLKNNELSLGAGFRGPKQGRFEVIEIILIEYINAFLAKGMPMNKSDICEKATEIARVTNVQDFDATQAWCNNFLLRHELYNTVADESEEVTHSKLLKSISSSLKSKSPNENSVEPYASNDKLDQPNDKQNESSKLMQDLKDNETLTKSIRNELDDEDSCFKCDQFCLQTFEDGNTECNSSDRDSNDECADQPEPNIPERQRQAYDAHFKISIVREAESTSNCIVAMKYGISEANIRRWRKVMPLLLTTELDRKTFRGPKKGRFEEIEKFLFEEISFVLKQGGKLRLRDIKLKAKLIGQLFQVEEFKASKNWCYRFLRRNGFATEIEDSLTRTDGKSLTIEEVVEDTDEDDLEIDEEDQPTNNNGQTTKLTKIV